MKQKKAQANILGSIFYCCWYVSVSQQKTIEKIKI